MPRPFFTHTTITDDSALGGSVIERSLRFNDGDSPYLSRTPSSAGNRRTYTISVWAKIIDNGTYRTILGTGGGTARDRLQIFDDDRIVFNLNDGTDGMLRTNRLARDPSAWYHFVVAVNTPHGTASNRLKLYVNGTRETSFETETYPSQNYDCRLNNNIATYIGQSSSNNYYHDGYLAEFNFIDGQTLDPSYFGYTDFQTKLWRPKRYTGTYGTNGFYLNFSDNSGTSATTLGRDSSGNGNNFTPNNFSVSAGAGNDSLEDTPTNNFPTINNIAGSSTYFVSTSNGNLDFSMADKAWAISSFKIPTSGKWYAECVFTDVQSGDFSVINPNMINDDSNSFDGRWNGIALKQSGEIRVDNSTVQSSLTAISNNAIVGVKIDRDAGTVAFTINGSANGTPVNISGMVDSSTLAIANRRNSSSGSNPVGYQNYGQRPFSHLPAGYKALCSANLPPTVPSINAKKHFDILTYSGNNTNGRNITGLEFTPDMVWIKSRTNGDPHVLQDITRTNGVLYPNQNGQEGNSGGGWISGFNSNGITINANGPINSSSQNYVAWCWKAGGAAVSNSDGTITTSISANQESGLSIVTYTGTGSAATIGHGLGKTPKLIIVKLRSGSQDWFVNNGMIFNEYGKYYKLNSSSSSNASDTNVFPNTAPTSTVFSVGTDGAVNASGSTYVAYVWSEISGFSKFGFYTGNGNANGPFVYTGFSPRFIIYRKKSDENWHMLDTKRDPLNPNTLGIDPNLGNAEANDSNLAIDILSNGFKLRSSHSTGNANGTDYFYYTWGEYTGATPYDTETNAR